jgi:hypothetical protein
MRSVICVALVTANLAASAAGDQAACDRLLKVASDQEFSARRAYLLSTPSEALVPMEQAAGAFEHYASQCGVESPLSYVGVLVHGRLSILYSKLSKIPASQQSASLAIKYGSMRAKKALAWPDIERVVANADAKQKQSIK